MRITLCGSARFEQAFKDWEEHLTVEGGHVVYGLAVNPSDKAGDKDWYDPATKVKLDLAHLAKIVHSDAVLVLNVGGYVGASTLRELHWARMMGKPVYLLENRLNNGDGGLDGFTFCTEGVGSTNHALVPDVRMFQLWPHAKEGREYVLSPV